MTPPTSRKTEETKHTFKTLAKKMGLDEVSIPFQWMWKIVAVVFAGRMAWATLYGSVSGLKQKNSNLESIQQSQAIQVYAMHDDLVTMKGQMDLLQFKMDEMLKRTNRSARFTSAAELMSLPSPEEAPIKHKTTQYEVEDGESLWDVAKKLNVSPDSLIKSNPDLLQPGAKFGKGLILKYEKQT